MSPFVRGTIFLVHGHSNDKAVNIVARNCICLVCGNGNVSCCSCRSNVVHTVKSAVNVDFKRLIISIFLNLLNILLEAEVVLLYVISVGNAYISVSIGSCLFARVCLLAVGETKNKAVSCGIFVYPSVIACCRVVSRA